MKKSSAFAKATVASDGKDSGVIHVAHDQQRRVFKVGAVLEKLVIGGVEVFLFAFVFPTKEIFFPDIGPAVAAAVLGRAFFKSECHAGRVSRSGLGMADEFAKIKEMLLGGGALGEVNLAPLGDKILGGHGSVANSAGFSRIGMGIFYTKNRRGGNEELNKSATAAGCPTRPNCAYRCTPPKPSLHSDSQVSSLR